MQETPLRGDFGDVTLTAPPAALALFSPLIDTSLPASYVRSFGLSAPRGHGVYVPDHVENGRLVPGHIE